MLFNVRSSPTGMAFIRKKGLLTFVFYFYFVYITSELFKVSTDILGVRQLVPIYAVWHLPSLFTETSFNF